MKILFLALVCLTCSHGFAQDIQDVPEARCNMDRKTLIDMGLADASSLPADCATAENRKAVERAFYAQGTTTNSATKPQAKKQNPPVAPQATNRDPNKFYCTADPALGTPVATSWDDCLTQSIDLYCKGPRDTVLLVTYFKGTDHQQKQFEKTKVTCPAGVAKKTAPVPTSPCRYQHNTVEVPDRDGNLQPKPFLSAQECAEYIRDNSSPPPGKCVFDGTSYGTYDLVVTVETANFYPPKNKGTFPYTNLPCKPPTKPKAPPANFGQPEAQPATETK